MRNLLFFIFTFSAFIGFSQGNSSSDKILPNTIMLKVKDEYRSFCQSGNIQHSGIQNTLNLIGTNKVHKVFPNHKLPKRKKNAMGIPFADISLIYKINYTGKQKVRTAAAKLMLTGYFEYAEPFFLHELQYTPNDPEINLQYHLTNIKAYQAWDVAKGNPNVVIGISDTGIELDHPDITNSIKYNDADPINGVDDDGDGYVDNYHGWDVGDNDNDPSWNVSKHGHSVSGTAAATTDNGTHVAGVGFNTKVLPLKITNSSQQLVGAYESIIYAADHGCKIINCSWGTVNSWSQYGQDVITYATIDKEALVVCAAGNDNTEGVFYPASFEWALSVGGTNSSNTKWISSPTFGANFNEHVDISAPAQALHTITTDGGTKSGIGGTSFSSPIVAGAAGLVWGEDLSLNGMQVGEILKATADSLELIPGNEDYVGVLGEGLLNCHRSVTETGFPGLYLYQFSFTGNNQGKLIAGDTVTVSSYIANFLAASSAGTTIKMTSKSPFVKMVDDEITVGVVEEGGSRSLNTTPFKFVVQPGVPVGEVIGFVFTITDGTYNTKRYAEKSFNVDFVDLAVNKVGTSIGSSGKVGYNALGVTHPGLGFTYNDGPSLLFHYGLIISDNLDQISFGLEGAFETEGDLQISNAGVESDFDIRTHFNDSATDNQLSVSVKQKSLAWTETQYEDFVILEYTVINNSAQTYNNLHLGMYIDWDIGNSGINEALFDESSNTAITYEPSGVYGGVHLMDKKNINHYAINNDGSDGSDGIYDGYTSEEQYNQLTNGNSRTTAGPSDVSQMVGNGPYLLESGDSLVFAVAIVAGDNLEDLKTNALESDTIYSEIRNVDITLNSSSSPSCTDGCNGSISVQSSGGIGSHKYLWNDPLAQTTASITGLCAGTYQCIVTDSLGATDTLKNIVLNNPSPITVSLGNDTTLCSAASLTLDAGFPGSTYKWSNGESTQEVTLSEAGEYRLTVITADDCIGRDTVNIYTGTSPTVNIGNDTTICAGELVLLNAQNESLSKLWSDGTSEQTNTVGTNGYHWVEVTNLTNCTTRDSILITVGTTPSVDLGQDITVCDSYNGSLDAGNPGLQYLWSTGETSQTINISESGSYNVIVSAGGDCTDRDTMMLTVEKTPNVMLGNDTAICRSSGFQLDAGEAAAYLWHDGSTTQTISAFFEGEYHVIAGINCIDKDTINISFKESPVVWYNSGFDTARNSIEGDVILDFGEPSGGEYSGTGVTGNIFNTITSGDGTFKIDYTYTDTLTGCASTTWRAIDVNATNAIFELEEGTLEVYPNPFNDFITVNINGALGRGKLVYTIYDEQGKLIQTGQLGSADQMGSYTIETYNLSSGMYHFVISSDVFKQDIKLVK